MKIVQFKDVTRTYVTGDHTQNALSGVDLEIDGGVKTSNLQMCLDAGANVIVAGSAVFEGNIIENVRAFKEIMDR